MNEGWYFSFSISQHSFNDLFSRTTWVSRYQKGRNILDFNKARNDVVTAASASAGPYANHMHFGPNR